MTDLIDVNLQEIVDRLEREVRGLQRNLELRHVASDFFDGKCLIQEGDCFLWQKDHPTRLVNVSSDGKWTFHDGRNCIEPHRIPDQKDHARLYTIDEVKAIVALAVGKEQAK